MTALVLYAMLGAYLVGLFPAAVKFTRMYALGGRCHHEDRYGGRDSYNNSSRSWCVRFHRRECWRSDGTPEFPDLLHATPLTLVWPVALIGLGVLHAAGRQPVPADISSSIEALERELGIGQREP